MGGNYIESHFELHPPSTLASSIFSVYLPSKVMTSAMEEVIKHERGTVTESCLHVHLFGEKSPKLDIRIKGKLIHKERN